MAIGTFPDFPVSASVFASWYMFIVSEALFVRHLTRACILTLIMPDILYLCLHIFNIKLPLLRIHPASPCIHDRMLCNTKDTTTKWELRHDAVSMPDFDSMDFPQRGSPLHAPAHHPTPGFKEGISNLFPYMPEFLPEPKPIPMSEPKPASTPVSVTVSEPCPVHFTVSEPASVPFTVSELSPVPVTTLELAPVPVATIELRWWYSVLCLNPGLGPSGEDWCSGVAPLREGFCHGSALTVRSVRTLCCHSTLEKEQFK